MNFKEYLTEKEGDKAAYRAFFDKMLKKYGVDSPEDLDEETRKKFFDEVDKGWKADKEEDLDECSLSEATPAGMAKDIERAIDRLIKGGKVPTEKHVGIKILRNLIWAATR